MDGMVGAHIPIPGPIGQLIAFGSMPGVGIGKGWAVGSEQGVHVDADPRVGGRGWNGRAFVHGADAIGEVVRHVIGVGADVFQNRLPVVPYEPVRLILAHADPVAVLVDPQIWVPVGIPSAVRGFLRDLTVGQMLSDGFECRHGWPGAVVSEAAFRIRVVDGVDDVMQ